jgi:cell division protein FtsW (lipid II flippase)
MLRAHAAMMTHPLGSRTLAGLGRPLRQLTRSCWIPPMGWSFWLKLMGAVLVVGLAVWLIMLLAGAAFYAWGALGTMVFFIAVIVLIAYIYDKRQQASWDEGP